ncbi:MAG: spondin domain-containing protein [Crocosphaera sp.]|nr:spondin domain-containing protein [Crocosphaera sp.]
MNNFLTKYRLMSASLLAILSTLTGSQAAQATRLRVTVENLAPVNGQGLAPIWVSFHDGSFDIFDVDETAPRYLELLAEDGITGDPGNRVPTDFLVDAAAAGLDLAALAAAGPESIAAAFAMSAAALNGGVQDSLFPDFIRINPFFAGLPVGEKISIDVDFDADPINNQFFSYASMLFPTNDGFIANEDPTEIPIFDDQGNFIGADFVVLGSEVWDAGTEVNDEDPASMPYEVSVILNGGVDENSTVGLHPGLLPPGSGGAVDFTINGFTFENADFSAPGYQIARITVEQITVPEPSTILGLLGLGSLGLLRRKKS